MWLAKARYDVPIVLHNMDMWPDSVIHAGFSPRYGSSTLIGGLSAWVNAMYASAHTVAFVTPSAGRELRRRGVPRNKLVYAPVWADESVFRPTDGSRLRRRLGFTEDDIIFGYAGALGKAQSVVELGHTVVSLPSSSPVKFLVLGSGTEQEELAQMRKHPDRIRFLGHVAHEEMTEYAAVPDVSFASLSPGGQEAFAAPSKIPAILACAKPILVVAAGDSADLVHASDAGIVVPPGDLRAMFEAPDPQLAASIGENCESVGSRVGTSMSRSARRRQVSGEWKKFLKRSASQRSHS